MRFCTIFAYYLGILQTAQIIGKKIALFFRFQPTVNDIVMINRHQKSVRCTYIFRCVYFVYILYNVGGKMFTVVLHTLFKNSAAFQKNKCTQQSRKTEIVKWGGVGCCCVGEFYLFFCFDTFFRRLCSDDEQGVQK